MHGEGIWADLIRQRFEKTVERLGLGVRSGRFKGLDTSLFQRPSITPMLERKTLAAKKQSSKAQDSGEQFELF
jgi:hypothetical protein